MGQDALVAGHTVALDRRLISSDAGDFISGVAAGTADDLRRAVGLRRDDEVYVKAQRKVA